MKRCLLILVSILTLSIVGLSVYFYQEINRPLGIAENTLFKVSSGSNVSVISGELRKRGWDHNSLALKILVKLYPELSKVKSGTYLVSSHHSILTLLSLIHSGKEHQFLITFIEGSTFKQWIEKLALNPYIKKTMSGLTIEQISQRLGIEHRNPEGLFFPDTYAFTENTSDFEILSRAKQRMNQHLDEVWAERDSDLPYKTKYEVLIMASIIEKETSIVAEQSKVSSVFVNRLNKGMRLQTDPTIIYGLGERYTGDLTFANMREKTAYNTYRIDGLPPTPIAMPGLSALRATVKPEYTNYLYFVANNQGQHYFSETLQEHNEAVKKYQLGMK